MTKKKMGAMKLSAFSGIKAQPEQPETELLSPLLTQVETLESPPTEIATASPSKTPPVSITQEPAVKSKPVTINIKITRSQHEWLTETARTVRDNNLDPVPPSDRVYPQHLMGVAIDLLQAKNIDWSQVKNVEDLKRLLSI